MDNYVSACIDCNLGKSDAILEGRGVRDERELDEPPEWSCADAASVWDWWSTYVEPNADMLTRCFIYGLAHHYGPYRAASALYKVLADGSPVSSGFWNQRTQSRIRKLAAKVRRRTFPAA